MNCEIHQLSPLRCEAFQAKEVLRAVLHTVIFGRALGVVRPRDVDCELFDLTYVTCGDAEAERAVDENWTRSSRGSASKTPVRADRTCARRWR